MPCKHALANGTGLPAERLATIHDHLTLALDATESRAGYSRSMREARSYVRAALRDTIRLMRQGGV